MNRKEKQEARADRYRELADKAREQSTSAYERSNNAVAGIVPGQPILVGHHSEKKHRRALDRSLNAMGKSVELSEKAEYYERKAEAAESNNAIYAEDDDAAERLEEKVAGLEKLQETMKVANKIIRDKKMTRDEKIGQLTEIGLTEKSAQEMFTPDCFGNLGFADFTLKNNGANIRRLKQRLEQVKNLKATPTQEYEINGVRVVENAEENRLQLFFGKRVSKSFYTELRQNGFRSTSTFGLFQSYLKSYYIRWAKERLQTYVEQ